MSEVASSSEGVAWGARADEVVDERVALVKVERVVNVEVEEEEVLVGTVGRNVTVANLVRVVVT